MGARNPRQRRLSRLYDQCIGAAVLVLIGIGLIFAALLMDVDPVWPLVLAISSITLGLSVLVSNVREASELAYDALARAELFDVELHAGDTPEWLAEQVIARYQQRGTE